jgi:tRNA-splicing ligase RtcB (3'-phosphate/5'-hydroxy nucleic acid ligase)
MKEFKGTYSSCIVYTDDIEYSAIDQIKSFLHSPAFEGQMIRIMPDCHAGAGAVIGFTSTFDNRLVPNVVGVDINCGVLAARTGLEFKKERDFKRLDTRVRELVPSGFSAHASQVWQEYATDKERTVIMSGVPALCKKFGINAAHALNSIGTMGGGNHYFEVGVDEKGQVWMMVHSGSRNFGLQIAVYHQKKAAAFHHGVSQHGLEWLEGPDMQEYFEDSRIACVYAHLSRRIMIARVLESYGEKPIETLESVHNYVGEDGIIRKGAISARAGQRVIIPWNMRDGCIIGTGLGNPDWNFSAPHGAGRRMGRKEAKAKIDLQYFAKSMHDAHVWTSCVSKDTLDEAPQAYKDSQTVEALIGDTVKVEARVKPVYNFKAGKES